MMPEIPPTKEEMEAQFKVELEQYEKIKPSDFVKKLINTVDDTIQRAQFQISETQKTIKVNRVERGILMGIYKDLMRGQK